jgi:hypothetical protein
MRVFTALEVKSLIRNDLQIGYLVISDAKLDRLLELDHKLEGGKEKPLVGGKKLEGGKLEGGKKELEGGHLEGGHLEGGEIGSVCSKISDMSIMVQRLLDQPVEIHVEAGLS